MPDLRPYQREGVEFLTSHPIALLADQMGVGKTPQAIVAADTLGAYRILIVCPAVLRRQWAREWEKFSLYGGKPTQIVTEAKGFVPANPDCGVIITSYDLLTRKTFRQTLLGWKPDVVIYDEAHFIRNPDARRTQAALGSTCNGNGGLLGAKATWFLTGTPAPNSVIDLFPIMRVSGVFSGSERAFRDRFAEGYEGQYGFVITRNKNVPDLKRRLGKIQLRRTRSQVLRELPPLSVEDITVEATESPLTSEKILHRLPEIDGQLTKEVEHFMETGTFLRPNMMASLRRQVGLMKVLPVCQLIAEGLDADPTLKVLVFGLHTMPLKFVRAYLHKFGSRLIFGGSSETRRQLYMDEFQTNPGKRVLIGQIHALGVGANLTAATEVWIFEPDWLPDNNSQAISRALRIGQGRPVSAKFVSLANTIDEVVTRKISKRVNQLAEIYGETG